MNVKPYFLILSTLTAVLNTIAISILDRVGDLQGTFTILLILKLSLSILLGLGMGYIINFIHASKKE
jgi:hypothetical protein